MPSLSFNLYKKQLDKLGEGAWQATIAEAINVAAKEAHDRTIKNAREKFVLRNKYTEHSIRFYPATPGGKKMQAKSGSVSDYMDEQESGGYRLPKQGSVAPEATLYARGGSKDKVVRKRYYAGAELTGRQFVGTPRGRSRKTGKKRPRGVYERSPNNKKLRLIRALERSKIKIKATNWHTLGVKGYSAKEVEKAYVKIAKEKLKSL